MQSAPEAISISLRFKTWKFRTPNQCYRPLKMIFADLSINWTIIVESKSLLRKRKSPKRSHLCRELSANQRLRYQALIWRPRSLTCLITVKPRQCRCWSRQLFTVHKRFLNLTRVQRKKLPFLIKLSPFKFGSSQSSSKILTVYWNLSRSNKFFTTRSNHNHRSKMNLQCKYWVPVSKMSWKHLNSNKKLNRLWSIICRLSWS